MGFSSSKPTSAPPARPPVSFDRNGRSIPVTHRSNIPSSQFLLAIESNPFQQWVSNMNLEKNQDIDVHAVEIQSVDLFGSHRVGFIKMKVDCTQKTDKGAVRLPGICFLRGPAVGMLVVLQCTEEGKEYCILVEQPRIPVGESKMLELPAGMIDDASHTFSGTAARELQEECDITVNESDLMELTSTYPKGICPSPGGCDEYLKLFCFEKTITKMELERMQGKLTGERDHGEMITLRIMEMEDVWKKCCDAKLLCALFLLQQLRRTR